MANRLPPSKRPERRPEPLITTSLSPEQLLRKATAMVVHMSRVTSPGEDRPTDDQVERIVLDAAKKAVADHRDLGVFDADLTIDGKTERTRLIDLPGIFKVVAQHWGNLDDHRAERFYEVVGGCVRQWIDDPDLSKGANRDWGPDERRRFG